MVPPAAQANNLAILAGEMAFDTPAELLLRTVDKAVAASFNGKVFGDPFGRFSCVGFLLFKRNNLDHSLDIVLFSDSYFYLLYIFLEILRSVFLKIDIA